jgi:hypothetical protein
MYFMVNYQKDQRMVFTMNQVELLKVVEFTLTLAKDCGSDRGLSRARLTSKLMEHFNVPYTTVHHWVRRLCKECLILERVAQGYYRFIPLESSSSSSTSSIVFRGAVLREIDEHINRLKKMISSAKLSSDELAPYEGYALSSTFSKFHLTQNFSSIN